MKREKAIGILFIIGAIGVFIPYTILTIIFDYPDILRQEPAIILTKFHAGGSALIFTWLAFALLGLPLLIAYSLLGKKLETKFSFVRWVTTIGIISGIVQIIGLLRWVFVVPVLANDYINTNDSIFHKAIIINFKVVHQFGGVLLGEHLGQLFTVIWTVAISYALLKATIISKWLAWFGFVVSIIYLFAQAELLTTVIPQFPVWDLAGYIGSTLWLLWLTLVGFCMMKINFSTLNKKINEI
jgi:Domain of unknown function (DUF4386)